MSQSANDQESNGNEYELKDGMTYVVRSGLVIEEGETVSLVPEEYEEHDDVLKPVEETGGAEE